MTIVWGKLWICWLETVCELSHTANKHVNKLSLWTQLNELHAERFSFHIIFVICSLNKGKYLNERAANTIRKIRASAMHSMPPVGRKMTDRENREIGAYEICSAAHKITFHYAIVSSELSPGIVLAQSILQWRNGVSATLFNVDRCWLLNSCVS